jgi:PAS domain S-box-containing protein
MNRLTISLRLLLGFLLAAALPLAGLGVFYSTSLEQSLAPAVLRNLASRADQKAQQVEQFAGERLAEAQTYSQLRMVREALAAYAQAFHKGGLSVTAALDGRYRSELALLANPGRYQDLLLIDSEGNVVFSLAGEAELGGNLGSAPYRDSGLAQSYRHAIAWLQTELAPFQPYPPAQGQAVGFLAAPVLDAGRPQGAIVWRLGLDGLVNLLADRTGLDQSGEVLLAQRLGDAWLYSAPLRPGSENAFHLGQPPAQAAPAMQKAQAGEPGEGLLDGGDGGQTAAAWRYLPSLQGAMLLQIDSAEAFAPARAVQRDSWLALLAFLGFAGIVAGGLGYSLARPIKSQIQAAERIADGARKQRVPVAGPPELKRLARAINRLLEREVFERKNLENRLHKRNTELQRLTDLHEAVLGHAGYAIIATRPDGNITLFNRAAERLLGYRAADLINRKTLPLFLDPQEIAQRARQFSEALRTPITPGFDVVAIHARKGLPNDYEWTFVRKDGSRLPVLLSLAAVYDVGDKLSGYLGFAKDISMEKAGQAKLQEQAELNQALLDSAMDAILAADEQGRIALFNPAAERLFGYPASAVLDRDAARLLPALAQAEPGGHCPAEAIRRDGSRLPVELAIKAIQQDGRRLAIAIVRDARHRKMPPGALEESA